MMNGQARLMDIIEKSLGDNPTKYDLASTFKLVYREYSKITFIHETHTPDFISFMNKLPKEKMNELNAQANDLPNIIRKSKIKYKIEEAKGISILGVLFSPIAEKESLPWNYLEVIDFMIDTLIEEIFE